MKKNLTIKSAWLGILLVFALSGCEKLQEFREKAEEMRKAQEAAQESEDIQEVENPGNDPQAAEKGNQVAFREDVGTVFAVNTTRSVKGEILDYLEINGDAVTKTSVDIFADTAGKLTKLNISIGDYVAKDQVIAEVDPSRPGTTFIASPVKSPISGTITDIPGQIGATIAPSVPIARVSRMDEIQIRSYISERFISKIKPGLQALLRFEAYPDIRFKAHVTEISPVVDPQSRTMEIKLALAARDRRIKAGMFAEVKIITEKKEGIVKIPAECLVKRYGGYYVFIVKEDGKVERRKVTPGIEIDNKLEIVEGLLPDEQVVIRGQSLLEDKAVVRVIERIQPLETLDVVE